jgi:hypothetical protein
MCTFFGCVMFTYSAVVLTQDAMVKRFLFYFRATEIEKTEIFS